jgi:hypothetical protein
VQVRPVAGYPAGRRACWHATDLLANGVPSREAPALLSAAARRRQSVRSRSRWR